MASAPGPVAFGFSSLVLLATVAAGQTGNLRTNACFNCGAVGATKVFRERHVMAGAVAAAACAIGTKLGNIDAFDRYRNNLTSHAAPYICDTCHAQWVARDEIPATASILGYISTKREELAAAEAQLARLEKLIPFCNTVRGRCGSARVCGAIVVLLLGAGAGAPRRKACAWWN